MNIWQMKKWQDFYTPNSCRSGLRLCFQKDVDLEVKRAFRDFALWLRREYAFPKRINIYVKSQRRIKALEGDLVCGTFFRPADRDKEPYVRIATGDYPDLLEEEGHDNALAALLWTVAHELTHYFQWLNDIKLTLIGEERQATVYANKIIKDYAQTRDHP